jgi:regulator of protease activity HflC (stomatin/prohibitin superfamily)
VSGVRTVEIGYRNNPRNKVLRESLMLTDDENIVDVQFAVQYTLSSGRDFLLNVRNPDESVLQAAETAIRQVVGVRRMDSVLYEDRGGVQADVLKVMQSLLDRYNLGILISNVTMQSAQRGFRAVGDSLLSPAHEVFLRAERLSDADRYALNEAVRSELLGKVTGNLEAKKAADAIRKAADWRKATAKARLKDAWN